MIKRLVTILQRLLKLGKPNVVVTHGRRIGLVTILSFCNSQVPSSSSPASSPSLFYGDEWNGKLARFACNGMVSWRVLLVMEW
jgi:hypothetical protein